MYAPVTARPPRLSTHVATLVRSEHPTILRDGSVFAWSAVKHVRFRDGSRGRRYLLDIRPEHFLINLMMGGHIRKADVGRRLVVDVVKGKEIVDYIEEGRKP